MLPEQFERRGWGGEESLEEWHHCSLHYLVSGDEQPVGSPSLLGSASELIMTILGDSANERWSMEPPRKNHRRKARKT